MPETGGIRCVDAHVAGQAVRLIVEGAPAPEGTDVASRLAHAADHPALENLRKHLLAEPLGHGGLLGAMLTAPGDQAAHAGILFCDAERWIPASGAGLMAAIAIALERGLVVTGRGDGVVIVETAAGLIETRAALVDGNVRQVTLACPPAAIVAGGVAVKAAGRELQADVVECAGMRAIVDAESVGLVLTQLDRQRLRQVAREIVRSLPSRPVNRLSEILFTGPAGERADMRIVAATPWGRVERSPGGFGTAAVMAVLDAMGFVGDDRALVFEGPANGTFEARIESRTGDRGAEGASVSVSVTGRPWITGDHSFVINEGDALAPFIL
ncbi:MAG TPA: proline racemase family protein [Vicinamibacterales bacterium]